MIVRLASQHRDLIRQNAIETYPNECCGLLSGNVRHSDVRITGVHPSKNLTKGDPRHGFEVDPKLRFDLMRSLESQNDGTSIIGHFHSHPDHPAIPSKTDLAMAYEPDMIWLICSITGDDAFEISAFRLNATGDGFDTLTLKI